MLIELYFLTRWNSSIPPSLPSLLSAGHLSRISNFFLEYIPSSCIECVPSLGAGNPRIEKAWAQLFRSLRAWANEKRNGNKYNCLGRGGTKEGGVSAIWSVELDFRQVVIFHWAFRDEEEFARQSEMGRPSKHRARFLQRCTHTFPILSSSILQAL